MRIVGTLPHPSLKITIFQQGERFSVKFERGGVEQTYKFSPEEGGSSLEKLKKMIGVDFLENVNQAMLELQRIRQRLIQQHIPKENYDEFEEII